MKNKRKKKRGAILLAVSLPHFYFQPSRNERDRDRVCPILLPTHTPVVCVCVCRERHGVDLGAGTASTGTSSSPHFRLYLLDVIPFALAPILLLFFRKLTPCVITTTHTKPGGFFSLFIDSSNVS
jgi:hypothetical protein